MRFIGASTEARSDDELLSVLYDLFATYRLVTLIKDDKITEDLRNLVFRRFGEPTVPHPHKFSYFMSCPWCLSMYFAAVAVAGRKRWPRLWGPVAKGLTFSALTGLMAESRTRAQEAAA